MPESLVHQCQAMTSRKARALWLKPPRDSTIAEEKLRAPGADELLIRTRYSAVSRGTETLIYRGEAPASEYARLQAPFQQGTLPDPVKHGYANVGVVERGPDDWAGQTVFCLYPHQTHYVATTEDVAPVPAALPAARAVLAANMETAINAVWDAAPAVGEHITVIGAGVVGALTAALCAGLPGADVELVDVDARKAFLGAALGARFARPDEATAERDLIFHASASEDGLNQALALAGFEARVIEMSWYGERAVTLALGGGFHARRLSIRASQVGALPAAQQARWDRRRRLRLALDLLADPRYDALIDDEQPFDQLPAVMQRLAEPSDPTLCARIRYD